jgi:hypothetical protein
LKEEALNRTMWRARFGRGFGPVVRQTAKWMNEWMLWPGEIYCRAFLIPILWRPQYNQLVTTYLEDTYVKADGE